jgi:hypothetical protein
MKHHLRGLLALLVVAAGLASCRDADDGSRAAEPRTPPTVPAEPAPPATPAAVPVPPAVREPPRAATPATAPRATPPVVQPVPATPFPAPTVEPAAGSTGTTAPVDGRPPAVAGADSGIRIRGLDVHPIDATEAEDGRGQSVPAVHPVALDVRADAWPGRALDPILEVGELRFRRYSHPGPGVLRYVAADADALPEGASVRLSWGDDDPHPTTVAGALQVPR